MKYSVSIILPVYNEEGNIEKVIQESINFLMTQNIFKEYEIIAVDDGSRDNTAEVLKKIANERSFVKTVTHSQNLGYGKTLISGFRNAKFSLIFFMDADGQFNISEIKNMAFYLENFDIITGYRYKRKDIFYRLILAKTYTWLIFLLFGLNFRDINCGFKLFKREILETDKINCHAGVFYTEVFRKAVDRGYKIKEMPVRHFPRLKGKQTGASVITIFKAVIDLIRLRYFLNRI